MVVFGQKRRTLAKRLTAVSQLIAMSCALTSCEQKKSSSDTGLEPAKTYSACTHDGQTDCITTEAFKAVDLTALHPEQIRAGTKVLTVEGNLAMPDGCDATNQANCLASAVFPAIERSSIRPEKIVEGSSILGIQGTATVSPDVCDSDGQVGCVAFNDFKTLDASGVDATKILTGTTIGGVTGTLATNPMACITTGQTDCVTSTTIPSKSHLGNSLLAHWTFDEASGGATAVDRADSSPNNLTLTDDDTVASTTGKIGNAAEITNGTTEYFQEASTPYEMGNQDFSISFWFQSDALTGEQTYLANWVHPSKWGWWIGTDGSVARFRLSANGTSAENIDSHVLSTGTWYHLIATYEYAAGVMRIYINGVLRGTNGNPASNTAPFFDNTAPFTIGNYDGGAEMFGDLDEVSIWRGRLLDQNDITYLYNNGDGRPFANW